MGGLLAKPVESIPSLFKDSVFFKKYPYLLPCLFGASFSVLGVLLGFSFLEETLEKKKTLSASESAERLLIDHEQESCGTLVEDREKRSTISETLTKDVINSILAYAMWAFNTVIFDEVLALFVATPVHTGGLSMTAKEFGLIMSLLGIIQICIQIFAYPVFERKFGLIGTFRFAIVLMILSVPTIPCLNMLARYLTDTAGNLTVQNRLLIQAGLYVLLSIRLMSCCFGYVCVLILVNDSSPHPRNLATVHGIGQVAAAFVRSIGPAIGGTLWSWSLTSANTFPLDFNFSFLFVSFICIIIFFHSYQLNHIN
jgi:hypothetical protein